MFKYGYLASHRMLTLKAIEFQLGKNYLHLYNLNQNIYNMSIQQMV